MKTQMELEYAGKEPVWELPDETQDADTALNADADVCECGHRKRFHGTTEGCDSCRCTGYKRKRI